MLGGIGEIHEPTGFGTAIEFRQVTLSVTERGQMASFGVGIETGGSFVPAPMSAQMDFGIEPVAPANNGATTSVVGFEF